LAEPKTEDGKLSMPKCCRVDFDYFQIRIIPSVQPTHATSDMYWAEQIGKKKVETYAYKLLQKRGLLHWELIFR
jgi:hypothetical protein